MLRKFVRQLRPTQENYIAPVIKIQSLLEELQFPKDIFDGFEFTQTQKSDKAAAQIRVSSADRDADRDEILRRLKLAGIQSTTKSTNSSVDPIVGDIDGINFVINVKPKSGGMGESTLNSSITELFPCIAFEKKLNPKNVIDFMEKLMSVDLKTCKSIIGSDLKAAEETVNKAEASSKYQDKMENALAILNFINDEHNKKPIKQVYWGYRGKPSGVPGNHPGDMFIEYTDNKMLGVSLKAGGKKTKEPQLNTYHNAVFLNSRGASFNDKSGLESLRKEIYAKVYSKIKGMPAVDNFDGGKTGRHKDKNITIKLIDKLPKKDFELYYNQYLEIVRQGLISRFNKNKDESLRYIKDAILREAPDVPTIVIKAIKNDYEEVTDRDELGVFLPQVRFVKAYKGSGKQDWIIDLKSGSDVVSLGMSVRSSSGGKLKQWSLKVTYNGLK
jgi:hypothetical protein